MGINKINDSVILPKLATSGSNEIVYINGSTKEMLTKLESSIDNKWKVISAFTAIPPTTSTITTTSDLTSSIYSGYGLKYKLNYAARLDSTAYSLYDIIVPSVANGYAYQCTTAGTTHSSAPVFGTTLYGTTAEGSGTVVWTCIPLYAHAIIKTITSNTITIMGAPLVANILELYFTDQDSVDLATIGLSDPTFTQVDTDILTKYTIIPTTLKSSYCVAARVWCKTVDTGATKSAIKPMNAANPIFNLTNGIILTASETYYDSAVTLIQANCRFNFLDNIRLDISEAGSNKNTTGATIELYYITL